MLATPSNRRVTTCALVTGAETLPLIFLTTAQNGNRHTLFILPLCCTYTHALAVSCRMAHRLASRRIAVERYAAHVALDLVELVCAVGRAHIDGGGVGRVIDGDGLVVVLLASHARQDQRAWPAQLNQNVPSVPGCDLRVDALPRRELVSLIRKGRGTSDVGIDGDVDLRRWAGSRRCPIAAESSALCGRDEQSSKGERAPHTYR